jgi:hypothetical protein
MASRIVLHIGTHKTGTTSIQQFLQDHNDSLLAAADVGYPPGFLLPTLHSDLPLLTVRPDRTWPARIRFPETQRPSWQAAAHAHVRREITQSPRDVLVFSHEDLSYLRFDDELDRLRDLLAGPAVEVVVFLRDPTAFLRSYRAQLEKMEFALSDDPASFAYVEPRSWLVDYDGLLAAYRGAFGEANVRVIDYDATLERDGSVIPAMAQVLGIEPASLPPLDPYFLNPAGTRLRLSDDELAAIRQRLAQQAP